MREHISPGRCRQAIRSLRHGHIHIASVQDTRHFTERKLHHPRGFGIRAGQIVTGAALNGFLFYLVLVFFRKVDVIEQETVVAGDIHFRDVVACEDFGNHRGQFVDGFPACLRHLLGRTVVSGLVYRVVEDIHQRMFEYLAVLLLVVFRYGLKRDTDGSILVSL